MFSVRASCGGRLFDPAGEAALAVELRLLVAERDRLREHVRARRGQARGRVGRRVGLLEHPRLHGLALGVARHQRDVLDRLAAGALLRHLRDPVVEDALLVDAAGQLDVPEGRLHADRQRVGLGLRVPHLEVVGRERHRGQRALVEHPEVREALALHLPVLDGFGLLVAVSHGSFFSWSSMVSVSGYSATSPPPPPLNWLSRKITNSAGFTGEIPISQMTCPASMTSGGLVSASHLTKNASAGELPNRAPDLHVRVRKLDTALRSWSHRNWSLGSNTLHCVPSMIDSEM